MDCCIGESRSLMMKFCKPCSCKVFAVVSDIEVSTTACHFIEICCFVDTYHIESCLRSDAICWVVKHEDVFFSPFLLQMPANLLSVVTFW